MFKVGCLNYGNNLWDVLPARYGIIGCACGLLLIIITIVAACIVRYKGKTSKNTEEDFRAAYLITEPKVKAENDKEVDDDDDDDGYMIPTDVNQEPNCTTPDNTTPGVEPDNDDNACVTPIDDIPEPNNLANGSTSPGVGPETRNSALPSGDTILRGTRMTQPSYSKNQNFQIK